MEIVKVDINELICPEYNPRQITDDEMGKLKNSINEFGYVAPIIVNKHNNHIVGGNQRYEALKSLGYTDVDVIFVDEPDLNREKALNIALNKISGEWDFVKLADILDDLELNDFDISLTGFDELELEDFGIEDPTEHEPAEIVEDDYEEPDDLEVTVELGDIYQLGTHRLMCGDCTVEDNLNKLMNGDKANIVLTDPPYHMNLDTDWSNIKTKLKFYREKGCPVTGNKYDKVIGDNDDFRDELITNIFKSFDYCKEIFLWGADYYSDLIPNRNDGSWIVWDKRSNEGINEEDVKQSDKMFGSCFELCWSKSKHKREIARVKWAGIFGTEKEFDKKRVHPTQKPTLLSSWFLNKYSKENDNVIDLFGGSGSTLIACEQLNRKCYMMELDPKYCQVIINRWEKFTGEKAEKIGGA